MKISFARDGWEDYISWAGERSILKRINRMIKEAARDPGTGIGKPSASHTTYPATGPAKLREAILPEDVERFDGQFQAALDTARPDATAGQAGGVPGGPKTASSFLVHRGSTGRSYGVSDDQSGSTFVFVGHSAEPAPAPYVQRSALMPLWMSS